MAKIRRTYSSQQGAGARPRTGENTSRTVQRRSASAQPRAQVRRSAPVQPRAQVRRSQPRRKRGVLVRTVLLAASAALLLQFWRTGMLPDRVLALLGGALAAFWLLVSVAQLSRRGGAFMRFCGWVVSVALVAGCVFTQQGIATLNNVSMGSVTGKEAQQIAAKPFLFYISGVDSRGNLNDKSRSDVNILAAVDPVNKRVALVNTPRDYYVELAGHDGAMDKLTHAGLYGVDCSMQTLGGLYGVTVTNYLKVDFQGFIDIVNALGGVDVTVDEGFTTVGSPGYYDPVTFTAGVNHLDGASALAFARERHAFANGDIQRGENQMKVISAMLQKAKSPAVLMGYSKILSSVSDSFVTDMSEDQIKALVKMQLTDGADWQIDSFTVTGASGTSTECYSAKGSKLYIMRQDEASVGQAKQMLTSVLAGTAPAGAASAASAASGTAAAA